MKKSITLKESELVRLVKIIVEEVDLSDYAYEDFIDVFFQVFRSWLSNKLGEDIKKYPMSYLLKQYLPEFGKEKELTPTGRSGTYPFDYWSIIDYGKELVNKSHYELPKLYVDTKFTDKYKKAIPFMIGSLGLPSFIALTLDEEKPNRVLLKIDVDYDGWLKYPERFSLDNSKILNDLQSNFNKYTGVQFGNPSHGEVEMKHLGLLRFKIDDWVKNILNKQIKPLIKGLPGSEHVKSIKFDTTSNGGRISIVFKKDWNFGTNERIDFINSARRAVEDKLGYGPNLTIARL